MINLPQDFKDSIRKLLSDNDYNSFIECYNKPYYRAIRINTLKTTFENIKDKLPFECQQSSFCKESYYISESDESIGNNPLHHAGAYYVQEPSASSAVELLDVQENDIVLDLCAAPGGKSTQIAAKLNGKGLIWSNEIVGSRANILLSNFERMGITNGVISSCHPDVLCKKLSNMFNKVLVDAPCSGEGMFRKHPDGIMEWSLEGVKSCAKRQLDILNSACNALCENGVLVYSTCTFSKEENEDVIEKFLSEHKDFIIEETTHNFGREGIIKGTYRIFPMDGGEGHFAVRLRKISGVPQSIINYDYNTKDKKQFEDAKNLLDELFIKDISNRLYINGNYGYILPPKIPNILGLGVLRSGILACELKKNRAEPCHHLFMSFDKEYFRNTVDFTVDSKEIKAFLHGEEISIDENIKGYTAVCVEGVVTGFGKASNGRLKNKYPKGLRLL